MTNVVFDVGNVLIRWDPKIPLRRHFGSDQEIEDFFKTVKFGAWNLSLDKGRDWDEAAETLASSFPQFDQAIHVFKDYWHESVPAAIASSVESLTQLKASNTPLFAITNFSLPRWLETQERFEFLKDSFRDVVVSGEVQMVKPHKEIFELFLRRNQLRAEDCIFIDDSAANIETALLMGFDAIHFDEETDLRFHFAERGLLS